MPSATPPRTSNTQGFTLIEMLVVMAILGVLLSIAVLNVQGLNNDAGSAASILKASLIEARTEAISTSSVRRFVLNKQNQLLYQRGDSCSQAGGWIRLDTPTLPDGIELDDQNKKNWKVCFTTRGTLSDVPISDLTITDSRKRTRSITVFLTGSVTSQ